MSEPEDLRIIRGRRALAELLGVSGMTVWRWEAPRGDLPARIRLGPPPSDGVGAISSLAGQAGRRGRAVSPVSSVGVEVLEIHPAKSGGSLRATAKAKIGAWTLHEIRIIQQEGQKA